MPASAIGEPAEQIVKQFFLTGVERSQRLGGGFNFDRQQFPDERHSGRSETDKDQPSVRRVASGHNEAAPFQPQHDVPDVGGLHGDEAAEKVLRKRPALVEPGQRRKLGGRQIVRPDPLEEIRGRALIGAAQKEANLIFQPVYRLGTRATRRGDFNRRSGHPDTSPCDGWWSPIRRSALPS